MLTSTAYDDRYYQEHKAAGLDYLGHGDWQRDYGRWLVESLGWRGKTILDVGCACGSIARGLHLAGANVVGVDLSESMIRRGRDAFGPSVRLEICDAVNLHLFRDCDFDGLHCAQSAEHWQPNLAPHILRELARVTKPGGLFFCALDTQELFERQARDVLKEDPTHVCIKPLAWWIDQCDDTGWRPIGAGSGPKQCALEGAPEELIAHPQSYLARYDWDWFLAGRLNP